MGTEDLEEKERSNIVTTLCLNIFWQYKIFGRCFATPKTYKGPFAVRIYVSVCMV